MSTATTTARTRLNCEALEPRENPSGNVQAFISGGIVFVYGDEASNRVQIEHNAAGDVYVHGFDNTLVNGQSSVYLGRGVPQGVRLALSGGNDRAEMIGLVTSGDVRFDMGTGNDQALILGCTAERSIEVYGQDGDDDTFMSRVQANFVILDGGNGFDVVHADNTYTWNGVWSYNNERAW